MSKPVSKAENNMRPSGVWQDNGVSSAGPSDDQTSDLKSGVTETIIPEEKEARKSEVDLDQGNSDKEPESVDTAKEVEIHEVTDTSNKPDQPDVTVNHQE